MPVHPVVVDGGHIALRALLLLVITTACASGPSARPQRVASDDNDVTATVLAARLPSGASACAVAQPRWVEPALRPLMVPLSAVDAFVWRDAKIIDVYAEAQQRDRLGPGATVRLIRFRGELSELRAHLAQNPSFDVRWDEAPSACRPDHCVVSARLIAPNVVRLDRGLWRERVPDAESRCVAMAREHGHAIELSVRGSQEMAFSGGMVPLIASSTRIEAGAQVVRVVQRDRMDSVEAAQVLAAAEVDLLQARVGSLGRTERTQNGNDVISTTELTWDDLRLGIDDRRRDLNNRHYTDLVVALEPDDGVDPRQLSHALEQLGLRIALLDHEPTSTALIESTVALAERIYVANPNDTESAYLLVRLYRRFAREPSTTQRLIEQHAPHDARIERWIDVGYVPPSPIAAPH